jgi:hypothetical protein
LGSAAAQADVPPENLGILTRIEIPPGMPYMVVDVLDGVPARYRTMAHHDFYGEFSCAGYVKAYYETVFGVYINHLANLGPPQTNRGTLVQVTVPQKGDIVFWPRPPHRNNHSAIVKDFDGYRITLIEQNFKWAQDGGTHTWFNRTVPFSLAGNPYEIWRLSHVPAVPFEISSEPHSVPPVGRSDEPQGGPPVEPPGEPRVLFEWTITDEPATEEVFTYEPEVIPVFMETIHPLFLNEAIVTMHRLAITINGVDMPITAPAFIENERAMMPVRWVCYALGLDSDDLFWDAQTGTAMLRNGDNWIRFSIGSNMLFVNQQPVIMDTFVFVRDGFSYLPVRFLAEALGVHFEWDPETASVHFYF